MPSSIRARVLLAYMKPDRLIPILLSKWPAGEVAFKDGSPKIMYLNRNQKSFSDK